MHGSAACRATAHRERGAVASRRDGHLAAMCVPPPGCASFRRLSGGRPDGGDFPVGDGRGFRGNGNDLNGERGRDDGILRGLTRVNRRHERGRRDRRASHYFWTALDNHAFVTLGEA
jgi:hypothetical protein